MPRLGLVGLDELSQPRGLIFVGKNGEPGRDHCPRIERSDLCHFIFSWLRLVSSPSPMTTDTFGISIFLMDTQQGQLLANRYGKTG
jgi:hypothetical protein